MYKKMAVSLTDEWNLIGLSVVVGDVDGEENLELVRTEAAGT